MKKAVASKKGMPIPILIIVSGIFLGMILYYLTLQYQKNTKPIVAARANKLAELSSMQRNTQVTAGEIPQRFIITKLSIDASIDIMGVNANGLLEAPAGPKTVGWYKYGPKPGEIGSAVIDGHYGRWANGEASVFDKLSTLKPGDVVSVINTVGVTTNFLVRELKTYDPKADDSAVFHSSDSLSHLNLITCDGSWNNNSQSYSRRLVVFTDKQ